VFLRSVKKRGKKIEGKVGYYGLGAKLLGGAM